MQINIANGTVSTVTQTLTATSGHSLPSKIVTNGATASYNSSTGMLTLTNLGETIYINIPAISSFNELSIEEHTGSNYITLSINDISLNINAIPIDRPTNHYLTFSSPSSFTLNIVDNTKYWNGTLEYSTDLSTWTVWDGTTTLSSGSDNKLYIRGTGNTCITGSRAASTRAKWVLTGSNISCEGNIENLLDYNMVAFGEHPTMIGYCYNNMFNGCTSLITTPEMPATTLTEYCYNYMFYGCSSLTSAPALPATTLVSHCYYGMFYNCTSLTSPAIMAGGTTQATAALMCCYLMYSGCTNLNIYTTLSGHTPCYKAIEYTTGSNANLSSYRMFYNCKIDGTTSTTNYLTAGTQYYCNAPSTTQGYSGSVIGTISEGGGTGSVYLKFDSAPSSSSDYDVSLTPGANQSSNQTLTTFSNKTKSYIWVLGGAAYNPPVAYYNNSTITLRYSSNHQYTWDKPYELTLTGNYDITLAVSYNGGSND